jgi:hypothetical protein
MICPNCQSSDLSNASLVYAAGLHESSGRAVGWILGSADGWWIGRYRGTSQSRLSKMVGPPIRLPYVSPVILWLVGFFVVMSLAGRGKLSWMMGFLCVAYILLLPAYLLGTTFYNLFVRPKKYRNWESTFLCLRCGALIGPDAGRQSMLSAPHVGGRTTAGRPARGGESL